MGWEANKGRRANWLTGGGHKVSCPGGPQTNVENTTSLLFQDGKQTKSAGSGQLHSSQAGSHCEGTPQNGGHRLAGTVEGGRRGRGQGRGGTKLQVHQTKWWNPDSLAGEGVGGMGEIPKGNKNKNNLEKLSATHFQTGNSQNLLVVYQAAHQLKHAAKPLRLLT